MIDRGVAAVLAFLTALVLGLAAQYAFAADMTPAQSRVNSNQITTAAAGTATVTLTGVTGKYARVYAVSARCNTGTASLTIVNGSTTVWDDVVPATTGYRMAFVVPVMSTQGTTMTVNLSTCGSGNLGTLSVHADIY